MALPLLSGRAALQRLESQPGNSRTIMVRCGNSRRLADRVAAASGRPSPPTARSSPGGWQRRAAAVVPSARLVHRARVRPLPGLRMSGPVGSAVRPEAGWTCSYKRS